MVATTTTESSCLLKSLPTPRPPAPLVPFPGLGVRRVATASDNGTALSWWGWQWDDCVLLVPVKAPNS
eukprot:1271384-Ditylum_brightwellii.AAC.1